MEKDNHCQKKQIYRAREAGRDTPKRHALIIASIYSVQVGLTTKDLQAMNKNSPLWRSLLLKPLYFFE